MHCKDHNTQILIGAKILKTHIMKSKGNEEKAGEPTASLSSEELRRRRLLARRQELRERLQSVHELLAERRALQEQIRFLRQLMADRLENSPEAAGNDGKQREE